VLCTSGEVVLEGGPTLGRGRAAYVADEAWLGVRGAGMVFVASVGSD
jgi:hypothetical protein